MAHIPPRTRFEFDVSRMPAVLGTPNGQVGYLEIVGFESRAVYPHPDQETLKEISEEWDISLSGLMKVFRELNDDTRAVVINADKFRAEVGVSDRSRDILGA